MRLIPMTLALLVSVAVPDAVRADTTPAPEPAAASPLQAGLVNQAAEQKKYEACMKLAGTTPKNALTQAMTWEKAGGGDAARHCVAAAYMGLGQYDDAALELERIARTLPQVKAPVMAQLFGQAAQAWMRINKSDRALADIDEGLKLDKSSVDLLVFRAVIKGNQEQYFDALDDLNAAYDLTSDRATILVLRATAYRKLDQPDLAKDNIDMALKADPNDPDALLERGTQRALAGDRDGARQDWLKTIELDPNSPAADDARADLADLDVKAN